jgi:hypothetical protein
MKKSILRTRSACILLLAFVALTAANLCRAQQKAAEPDRGGHFASRGRDFRLTDDEDGVVHDILA